MIAWQQGKNEWRKSANRLQHGRLGEPYLEALAMNLAGDLVREMLAEPPPAQRCTELTIVVRVEITASPVSGRDGA